MGQPYVGEIRCVGFSFAPVGWALCDGTLQSIANNQVLYTVIGTTYGGDGVQTFALPDLRGRVPLHQGTGIGLPTVVIGQSGGTENVTLATSNLPIHSHAVNAEGATGASNNAIGGYFAMTTLGNYGTTTNAASGPVLRTNPANQGLSHANIQPYLTINYIISLFGIFPSQS